MPVVANFAPIVARAETEALTGDAARTLTVLRDLPLADFMTILFTLPDPSLPGISAVLPRMASEEVQRAWHGSAGEANLRGTVEFGSLLAYLCEAAKAAARRQTPPRLRLRVWPEHEAVQLFLEPGRDLRLRPVG